MSKDQNPAAFDKPTLDYSDSQRRRRELRKDAHGGPGMISRTIEEQRKRDSRRVDLMMAAERSPGGEEFVERVRKLGLPRPVFPMRYR